VKKRGDGVRNRWRDGEGRRRGGEGKRREEKRLTAMNRRE